MILAWLGQRRHLEPEILRWIVERAASARRVVHATGHHDPALGAEHGIRRVPRWSGGLCERVVAGIVEPSVGEPRPVVTSVEVQNASIGERADRSRCARWPGSAFPDPS